jgi:pilus assembly protein Flp/PilA
LRNRSGATAIEYCFIAGLIGLAIVAGLTVIGTKLNHIFTQIAAVN